jgi:hypothetical protein
LLRTQFLISMEIVVQREYFVLGKEKKKKEARGFAYMIEKKKKDGLQNDT